MRAPQADLGLLDRERGLVELDFSLPEHDELVEHGDAEPRTMTVSGILTA